MNTSLLILFFSFIRLSKSYIPFNPQQIINQFSSYTYAQDKLQLIIDSLGKTFNDSYSFNEIVKNLLIHLIPIIISKRLILKMN